MKKFNLRSFIAIFASFCFCISAQAQTRQETFAITNAQIATVSGPVIQRGTIVVRNGLIEAVGENVRVPADAATLAAAGTSGDANANCANKSSTTVKLKLPGRLATRIECV